MGVTKADCFLLLLLYFIKQSRVLPRSCACPHSAPSQRGQWNVPMAVECHQGVAGTRTSLRSPTRGAFHVWGAAPSLLTEPLSAHGFSALFPVRPTSEVGKLRQPQPAQNFPQHSHILLDLSGAAHVSSCP